jgi:hypothetical protein
LKRKKRKPLNLTAEHAAHAIGMLVSEGRIAERDVVNALHRREKLMEELRERLAALESGAMAMGGSKRKARGRQRPRAKLKLSAARRAALKLHGKYLGTVRPLSKANRVKVKAIREKSGVRAAIAAARKIAK